MLSRLLVEEIWISRVPRAVLVVITSRLTYGSLMSVALLVLMVILGFFKLFVFDPPLVATSFFWFTLLEPLRYLFLVVRELEPLEASALTLAPSMRAPFCWVFWPIWKLWLQAEVVVMLPLLTVAFLGVFPRILPFCYMILF